VAVSVTPRVTPGFDAGTLRELIRMKLAALAQAPENETKKALAAGWQRLATVIREVKVPGMEDVFPGFAGLFERKTFDEPLKYSTDQYWLKRYEGACDTSRALSDHRKVVLDAAEPWQAWLYEKLINQVDGYVDQLKQYLLLECKFEFDEEGGIDFARPRALAPVPVPSNLSIVLRAALQGSPSRRILPIECGRSSRSFRVSGICEAEKEPIRRQEAPGSLQRLENRQYESGAAVCRGPREMRTERVGFRSHHVLPGVRDRANHAFRNDWTGQTRARKGPSGRRGQ
jgi:hypothetical protein